MSEEISQMTSAAKDLKPKRTPEEIAASRADRRARWHLHMCDLLEWMLAHSNMANALCESAPPAAEWTDGDGPIWCNIDMSGDPTGGRLTLNTEVFGGLHSPILAKLKLVDPHGSCELEVRIPRSVVDASMRRHGFGA